MKTQGYIDASTVKRSSYSCRGLEFSSQQASSSQLPISSVLGNLLPLASMSTCTHVHIPPQKHIHIDLKKNKAIEEMIQQLRTLATLPGEPGSIPIPQVMAQNSL